MDSVGRVLERFEQRLDRLEAAQALPAPGRAPATSSGVRQVAAFVASACRLSASAICRKDTVYSHYRAWCRERGALPYGKASFFKLLYQASPSRKSERRMAEGGRMQLVRGIVPEHACYQQRLPGAEA